MTVRRKNLWYQLAGIAVCLFFAFTLAKDEVGMSGNEAGRFAVIQAVAEQNVFHIENTNFRTVDRLIYNHHIYYDKPLAYSWCIGQIYRPFHRIWGLNFVDNYYFLIFCINFLLGATINSLLFLGMYHLLHHYWHRHELAVWLLALGSVFSTWLFSYSVMINNHNIAALALLWSFIAMRHCRYRNQIKYAIGSGLCVGVAGAAEWMSGAFGALGLLTFALWRPRRGKFLVFSGGCGLAILLGVLGLNYVAYGNISPLYIINGQGTFHLDFSKMELGSYAFDVLFGIRGIFSYMPFLLLALVGYPYRNGKSFDRAAAVMILAFFGFYIICTNEYGGASYGFRYLIPAIPLLYFYAARSFFQFKKWGRYAASGLLIWGVVTSYIGAWQPFCVGFEGYRSPPGHFTRVIKSSFGGNLLGYLYEHHHDSIVTQKLIDHYDRRNSGLYLYFSFFSIKDFEQLARIRQDFPELNFK